mmetsp:Transcript_19164/g.60271  ORF Transcript_19164/g.60271 Transcript_19164/m.60271 type:complete len:245 (+) Transcript_19164:1004-1738(+)
MLPRKRYRFATATTKGKFDETKVALARPHSCRASSNALVDSKPAAAAHSSSLGARPSVSFSSRRIPSHRASRSTYAASSTSSSLLSSLLSLLRRPPRDDALDDDDDDFFDDRHTTGIDAGCGRRREFFRLRRAGASTCSCHSRSSWCWGSAACGCGSCGCCVASCCGCCCNSPSTNGSASIVGVAGATRLARVAANAYTRVVGPAHPATSTLPARKPAAANTIRHPSRRRAIAPDRARLAAKRE